MPLLSNATREFNLHNIYETAASNFYPSPFHQTCVLSFVAALLNNVVRVGKVTIYVCSGQIAAIHERLKGSFGGRLGNFSCNYS